MKVNVLSIARSLSKAGVKVYAINHPDVSSLRSRYLTRIAIRGDSRKVENWRDYLLSSASDHLKGAVLFCCSDQAINLLIENWDALSARFVLEACPRETRARLLDKQLLESASSCGIAHPKFWSLEAGDGVGEVAQTCLFPGDPETTDAVALDPHRRQIPSRQ